jgi:hypothetical protein
MLTLPSKQWQNFKNFVKFWLLENQKNTHVEPQVQFTLFFGVVGLFDWPIAKTNLIKVGTIQK